MKASDMLKWPLILAAIVVVTRVILEQAGAPDRINNLASVVMLYLVICPLYFAYRLATSDAPRPYITLLKFTVIYAVLARAMVIPTYWLARIFQWPQARFSAANGGVVGPEVTPIAAFLIIPIVALIAWTIAAALIGGGLGAALLAIKRR